jgi:hypothetical protein
MHAVARDDPVLFRDPVAASAATASCSLEAQCVRWNALRVIGRDANPTPQIEAMRAMRVGVQRVFALIRLTQSAQ